MVQTGAVFQVDETYIRMKDSGYIYPFNAEQQKLVKKELADFVKCVAIENGEYKFDVIRTTPEEPKKISTPRSIPQVQPATATAPASVSVPVTAAEPVMVVKDAEPPVTPHVRVAKPPSIDLNVE